MKKTAFAATLAAFLIAKVQANTVGLYLGGQVWQSEVNGIFGEKNTLIDFNLKKEQQGRYFIAFEHPYPLLPYVRIANTNLDTTGKTYSTQTVSFVNNGITHTSIIDTNIVDSINMSYVDYTLYFELINNDLFSLDMGVTARDFDGGITATESTTAVNTWQDIYGTPYSSTDNQDDVRRIKTDEIKAMLYVATNINLPLTGLSLFAQGDFLLMNEHSLSDYHVGLSYDLVDSRRVDFNLTLGYRTVNMEFEDLNNLYTELEFKGAFVGVIVHF